MFEDDVTFARREVRDLVGDRIVNGLVLETAQGDLRIQATNTDTAEEIAAILTRNNWHYQRDAGTFTITVTTTDFPHWQP